MPNSQDIDIGRETGIYPLPEALSPHMRAGIAVRAATNEMRGLPRSTPENSPAELEDKYQYLVPPVLQRRVGDDEYDQMVRHNALIQRLKAIENENPEGYRSQYKAGAVPLHSSDLQKADRPPVRYRPTSPLGTPGNPVAEGLRWWDSTTSMPLNALRMASGDTEAVDDFAKNADTFLMRVPTFLKSGSFSPQYDNWKRAVGSLQFDDPAYMQQGRADFIPYYEDTGSTGSGDVLVQFGAPEGTATDIAGLLVDGFIDPDGGALRAARALTRGRLGATAAGLFQDNALPASLYGGARYAGSGPISEDPRKSR